MKKTFVALQHRFPSCSCLCVPSFFSFSPCITRRRQKNYFLPRLSNQENGVLQGNKVSYSIESWKWGIFRQRQLFCNRKISSVLGCPAFSTGFPHSTVCSPSGRGGHFCPSTSLWLISGQKCPPLPSWQHTVSWGKPVLHAGPPTTFSFSPCSRAFSLSTYTAFPWFYWIKERFFAFYAQSGFQQNFPRQLELQKAKLIAVSAVILSKTIGHPVIVDVST